MATPIGQKATPMCNIAADVLEKQLVIDSIPHCMMITGLFIITVLTIVWYIMFKRTAALSLKQKSFVVGGMCLVFFPLWYQASFLMTSVATNIMNPEYASILKFAQGCPESLR